MIPGGLASTLRGSRAILERVALDPREDRQQCSEDGIRSSRGSASMPKQSTLTVLGLAPTPGGSQPHPPRIGAEPNTINIDCMSADGDRRQDRPSDSRGSASQRCEPFTTRGRTHSPRWNLRLSSRTPPRRSTPSFERPSSSRVRSRMRSTEHRRTASPSSGSQVEPTKCSRSRVESSATGRRGGSRRRERRGSSGSTRRGSGDRSRNGSRPSAPERSSRSLSRVTRCRNRGKEQYVAMASSSFRAIKGDPPTTRSSR